MRTPINQSEVTPSPKIMLLRAALIQGVAMLLTSIVAWGMNFSVGTWIIFSSILAGVLSYQSDLPRWWLIIHILFLPALAMVYSLALPPWVFLTAFAILFAIFGSVFFSRVPLYLSGVSAFEALEKLMPVEKNFYFLDLGCGTGSVLHYMDQRFAFGMFHGVETAPLPLVISWLRSKIGQAEFVVTYKDMWQMDLSQYDVVYAFLSPQPMSQLWEKVQAEMRPDTLFISNSFAVPGVEPDEIIELNQGRATALLVWRIKPRQQEAA